MKENDSDDSDENSEVSENSESDDFSDEPVIIRPHKHNLRKKAKKINYNESRKSQNISEQETTSLPKSASSNEIIKKVLEVIIKSLNHYWQEPDSNTLISTILDPRYKDLSFLSNEALKTKTEIHLQELYNDLKFELNPDDYLSEELSTREKPFTEEDSIFNTLFGVESQQHKKKVNEVDVYLNENIIEKAGPNTNSFEWWANNKQKFPILAILARKYLSIPATSVPSERLFSDAGNNMPNKRTRLSPKFFQEILFIKRNSKYLDIFTLLANQVNILINIFNFF